ncbi:prepilin-type N-terminal cleavage/methylation domain-containing protein [Vibrio splendidus]|uniref:prepilin-type N-terminal cleavage/methylation domain-containing protein n=1 Tax=Vibrio splendidus TaxID=29497 RepID=UPI0002EE59DB|nr:prepilin-type N-terminal cleavage/methylation domain-containing protein [Vibrio splendidus]KPM01330.1 type IV prepilin, MshO [Vibrio splendidus]MCC4788507.1 prepilin-type N-terminal cleavage/methylation domain-containing protein [Vibrio splendidus]MDH5935251.1 prepilin-type N-terminal cleavage/methylation domain-containing protein [Vibrio splendidus]MDP2588182.1 prepilin-type N-terminal cleavage/methylation domain-containing protein [Vibrio splendidus]OEE56575.1 type IV prepilin, MshO [Vibr
MKQRGFTLIEMIVTIVVVAVIGLAIAGFVEYGMKGYVDTIDRQKVQVKGQFVVEKMSREISHAVPNSFDSSITPASAFAQKCLTFYAIKYSGFYHLNEATDDLNFIIGQDSPILDADDFLIINPTNYSDLGAGSTKRISVSGLVSSNNVFTASPVSLSSQSIAQRHYIYDDSASVSYCLVNDTVQNQGLIQRNGITVADSINYAQSNFRYEEPSLQRGGVIHIDLVLEQNSEVSVYQQDVQVLNAP